ncbi:hypothetical protein D3C79_982620 [compost metagenome]
MRRSRYSARHNSTITTTNGSATTIVRFCNPVSASPGLLGSPIANMTAATVPVSAPQKITVRRDGAVVPCSDRVPMTSEAASAPETKKMPTRIITSTEVNEASG